MRFVGRLDSELGDLASGEDVINQSEHQERNQNQYDCHLKSPFLSAMEEGTARTVHDSGSRSITTYICCSYEARRNRAEGLLWRFSTGFLERSCKSGVISSMWCC